MKKLKFKEHFVESVLSGEKDSTWRLFDDKNLQVGDKLEFINASDGKEFANAEILSVIEKKLGEIQEDDFEGHEKFKSLEEMYETYKKYYGDEVNSKTSVKIIKFKLL